MLVEEVDAVHPQAVQRASHSFLHICSVATNAHALHDMTLFRGVLMRSKLIWQGLHCLLSYMLSLQMCTPYLEGFVLPNTLFLCCPLTKLSLRACLVVIMPSIACRVGSLVIQARKHRS